MTNAVSINQNQPMAAPPPMHPALSRSLDILLSGANRGGDRTELLPGKALTTGERSALEARRRVLERCLDHRDNRAVAQIVADMLASYPSARTVGEEARMVIAAYVSSLSDLPPWSISDAAKQWARGKAGSDAPAFPPSSAQLYASAEANISRLRLERSRIADALQAVEHQPTDDERARVAAGFDRLRDSLSPRKKLERDSARASLEQRCRDLGIDPSAIDAVPNQPERKQVGTWSKLPAQPERTEA
jgi:hypothetical protein